MQNLFATSRMPCLNFLSRYSCSVAKTTTSLDILVWLALHRVRNLHTFELFGRCCLSWASKTSHLFHQLSNRIVRRCSTSRSRSLADCIGTEAAWRTCSDTISWSRVWSKIRLRRESSLSSCLDRSCLSCNDCKTWPLTSCLWRTRTWLEFRLAWPFALHSCSCWIPSLDRKGHGSLYLMQLSFPLSNAFWNRNLLPKFVRSAFQTHVLIHHFRTITEILLVLSACFVELVPSFSCFFVPVLEIGKVAESGLLSESYLVIKLHPLLLTFFWILNLTSVWP